MTVPILRAIIREVAESHGLTPEQLCGLGAERRLYHPRQEAMWRCRQLLREDGSHRFSYPQIGRALGQRDHTTIIHGVRRYEGRQAAATVNPLTKEPCHAF